MIPVAGMFGWRGTRAVTVRPLVLLAFVTLATPNTARAQEDQLSPPAPLPWPALEPGPTSNRRLDITTLRLVIESQANVALCGMLMKQANQPIPDTLTWSLCPTEFQTDIASRQGEVSWASGAKPSECGTSCVGRPFMTQSSFLDRPNAIYAMLYGHLDFVVDVPGPLNRTVRYGYEADFRCVADSDARGRHFTASVVFEPPVVGDPGFWESIANFMAPPADLSRRVEDGIRANLSTPGSETDTLQSCTSIGVNQAAQPSDDAVLYNAPPQTTRPHSAVDLASTVVGRTATVHFLRITRKSPTFGYTPAVDAGQFQIFLNGIEGNLPDTLALHLPAAGGGVAINFCKTIDVGGVGRLQLIFANSNGGAVWSQFAANASLGAGPARTMTTARTVVVPGHAGPPDPRTGKPASVKPQPLVVREYELLYTIDYVAPVSEATSSPVATGGVAPTRPGRRPPAGGFTLGGGHAATEACRKI